MPTKPSLMLNEATSTPSSLIQQKQHNKTQINRLSSLFHQSPPSLIITLGRGSSSAAADFFRFCWEHHIGTPCCAIQTSLSSCYKRLANYQNAWMIAFSQSGESPDLIETAAEAKKNGVFIITITNQPLSPLAQLADEVLDINMGKEQAIAATKSVLGSFHLILQLICAIQPDKYLTDAVQQLPEHITQCFEHETSDFCEKIATYQHLYTSGRGYGLATAHECALKFKECCQKFSQGYSHAELMHGPLALLNTSFPILSFWQNDNCASHAASTIINWTQRHSPQFIIAPKNTIAFNAITEKADHPTYILEMTQTHPACQQLLFLSFIYACCPRIAEINGLDADTPPHIQKVTRTQ